jgi:hypothetical protein
MTAPMATTVMMSGMILSMCMLLFLVLLSTTDYHALLTLVLWLIEKGANVCGLCRFSYIRTNRVASSLNCWSLRLLLGLLVLLCSRLRCYFGSLPCLRLTCWDCMDGF